MMKEKNNCLKHVLITAVVCVAVLCAVIAVLGYHFLGLFTPRFHQTLRYSEFLRYVDENYVGDYVLEDVTSAAMEGAADSLSDRWTLYYSVEKNESSKKSNRNEFSGVGIHIRLDGDSRGVEITRVMDNSPALEAGILPGDVITHVEGESIAGMTLSEASELMRRKDGETLNLTLLRGEETLDVSPVAGTFYTPPVHQTLLEGHIGLITIENFQSDAAESFIAAYESLLEQGADAFIFDVRNNGGGYVSQLTEILDYLLPECETFKSVQRGYDPVIYTSDANCQDHPAVVLFNSESYSAAEYFGAFLSSYGSGYAQTVGTHTTGKGRFQVTYDLMDGDGLHISIGEYMMPSGLSLYENGGVAPDYEVILSDEDEARLYAGLLPAEEDEQLQKAISLLLTTP